MEILGKLGIDPMLLIAQILNFCILLWLLTRFLYRPALKRIIKDEEELAQGAKEMEQLKKEHEALKAETAKTLKDSKTQAREIIVEAEAIAHKIRISGHDPKNSASSKIPTDKTPSRTVSPRKSHAQKET